MNCASHPGVETNLSCSKCGKPICPKCLVQTPVGARCTGCAGMARLPTFHVSLHYYLRAIGVALGMAIIFGLIWGTIEMLIGIFSLTLLMAPAAGFVIGEITSIAVNRKRGKGLAAIASVAVVVSFLLTLLFPRAPLFHLSNIFNIVYTLLALGLGIFVTITRLR